MRATASGSGERIEAYLSITASLLQTSPSIPQLTCFHVNVLKLLGWAPAKVT